jgi:hypothetical protein
VGFGIGSVASGCDFRLPSRDNLLSVVGGESEDFIEPDDEDPFLFGNENVVRFSEALFESVPHCEQRCPVV